MTDPAFPLVVDGRGRTAVADHVRHVEDLIEAVLFTAPGERVNRPDFGCGLRQSVFAPADVTAAGAAELQVRSGLQRWLGDVVELDDVTAELGEATLRVTLRYRIRSTGVATTSTFERSR